MVAVFEISFLPANATNVGLGRRVSACKNDRKSVTVGMGRKHLPGWFICRLEGKNSNTEKASQVKGKRGSDRVKLSSLVDELVSL